MTIRVAFLGPAGTFTQQAALRFAATGVFGGGDVSYIPVNSPAQALCAVAQGDAEFAVAAIENSVDGPVTPTFDALAATPGVRIVAETDIDISFAMMARPGTQLSEVTTVTTHPVAYQQVTGWLDAHVPGVEFVAATSNAAAARDVADARADLAAAPAPAAELFGLEIIADGVADVRGARTRFVAITTDMAPLPEPTGNDRTAVAFTLTNAPGALVAALTEFSLRGVDLSRIESRPTRTHLGSYRFHTDIVGHIYDTDVAEALRGLHTRCHDAVFLGSWPQADNPQPADTPQAHAELAAEKAARQHKLHHATAWIQQITHPAAP